MSAVDALGPAYFADVAGCATVDESAPLGPSEGPPEDRGPYYLREWRGAPLHGCPEGCGYTGRSTEAVDRHRAKEHPTPPVLSASERAARAGIIIPGHGT